MSRAWFKDMLERVLSTAAQAAIPSILATGWSYDALYITLGAAGLSVLKALAALRVGDPDSASLNPTLVSGDGGHSDVELMLTVATAIGVLLLLFGVAFR